MNFQTLERIQRMSNYFDTAFSRAAKKASEARSSTKMLKPQRGAKPDDAKIFRRKQQLYKERVVELARVNTASKELRIIIQRIIKSFPSMDDLHIFYVELMKLYFNPNDVKKSLAALNWAMKKIGELNAKYTRKIKSEDNANAVRKEFYGRISSIMKQVEKDFDFLEKVRRRLVEFPTIKTKLLTLSIVGFPNVGKTTLLTKITTAKPEIASYAFTTRRLNLGYATIKDKKLQLVDTPGTLNRLDKMNDIEKQAYLSMKYVSHAFIYVFDLTETSYPLEDQIKLYNNLEKLKKDVIVYLSKTDLLEEDYSKFMKKYKAVDNIDDLKKELSRLI